MRTQEDKVQVTEFERLPAQEAEAAPEAVGQVMIGCPVTGRPVSTNMTFSAAAFARSELAGNTLLCSACGGAHVWDKGHAWLDLGPA